MAIDNGIGRMKKIRDQETSRSANRERNVLFNKLHVTLMSAPGVDREATRLWLPEVEKMTPTDRIDAVRGRFGEQVLSRCLPALNQLESLGM